MSKQDHNIHLVCANCSAPFSVLHELAGHQAVCPRCGHQLQVPDRPQAGQAVSGPETVRVLKDELHTHRKCPVCEAPVDPTDSICVRCGYDLARGRHLHTEFKGPRPRGALLRRLVILVALMALAYALYVVLRRHL